MPALSVVEVVEVKAQSFGKPYVSLKVFWGNSKLLRFWLVLSATSAALRETV
jgi:hypothetical protein